MNHKIFVFKLKISKNFQIQTFLQIPQIFAFYKISQINLLVTTHFLAVPFNINDEVKKLPKDRQGVFNEYFKFDTLIPSEEDSIKTAANLHKNELDLYNLLRKGFYSKVNNFFGSNQAKLFLSYVSLACF
jgi:hypothetical protein